MWREEEGARAQLPERHWLAEDRRACLPALRALMFSARRAGWPALSLHGRPFDRPLPARRLWSLPRLFPLSLSRHLAEHVATAAAAARPAFLPLCARRLFAPARDENTLPQRRSACWNEKQRAPPAVALPFRYARATHARHGSEKEGREEERTGRKAQTGRPSEKEPPPAKRKKFGRRRDREAVREARQHGCANAP